MSRSPQQPDLRLLRHHRAILERDIAGLEPAALDWRPTPQAVSIASLLLHIGAVEYISIAAVAGADGDDDALWPALRRGFERNLGIGPVAGQPLSHYSDLLTRVRRHTERVLEQPWRPVDIERAQREVLDGLEPGDRRGLNAPLGLPVTVVGDAEKGLVVSALIAHEEYHRGQVTQTKFLGQRLASP